MSQVVALLSMLVVIGLYLLGAVAFIIGFLLVMGVVRHWGVR